MPGAPNRPPDLSPEPSPAVAEDARARRILRRLVPSKVALKLDQWKGPLHPDLFTPYDRAEHALDAGDLAASEAALDLLSVRFAEPRWPTIPAPFKELRVEIVQPQPPNWDPEAKLDSGERDARKAKRLADRQIALARGSLDWAKGHGIAIDDLTPGLDGAEQALASSPPDDAFWAQIDQLWAGLRPRIPPPLPPVSRKVVAPEPEPAAASETQ